MAGVLGISRDAVKKTWRRIHERMEAVAPNWSAGLSAADDRRGKERRRRLIQYLRSTWRSCGRSRLRQRRSVVSNGDRRDCSRNGIHDFTSASRKAAFRDQRVHARIGAKDVPLGIDRQEIRCTSRTAANARSSHSNAASCSPSPRGRAPSRTAARTARARSLRACAGHHARRRTGPVAPGDSRAATSACCCRSCDPAWSSAAGAVDFALLFERLGEVPVRRSRSSDRSRSPDARTAWRHRRSRAKNAICAESAGASRTADRAREPCGCRRCASSCRSCAQQDRQHPVAVRQVPGSISSARRNARIGLRPVPVEK